MMVKSSAKKQVQSASSKLKDSSIKSTSKSQRSTRSSSSHHNAVKHGEVNEEDVGSGEDELAHQEAIFVSPTSTPSKRKADAINGSPISIERSTRSSSRRTSQRNLKSKLGDITSTGNEGYSSLNPELANNEATPTSTLSRRKSDTPTVSANEPEKLKPKKRRVQNTSIAVANDGEVLASIRHLHLEDHSQTPGRPVPPPHPHVSIIRDAVLAKLAGTRLAPLNGLEEECTKVRNLLQQTVRAGEGNSVLVIGARGTGKTTMVNQLIEELSQDDKEHFHVIRLNGFIHTDDKLALREIWRQLGREMEVDDQGQPRNYADTLATLLAMLSHPTEISGEIQPDQAAKSVIFILDEFDLFASHPRQTLLYNLFDIAQARKAPVAVLGLTTRVDALDSLEKRVKSRFSHRHVHLGLPKTLNDFTDICKSALQLHPDELSSEHAELLTENLGKPQKSKKTKSPKVETLSNSLNSWNSMIDGLLEDPRVKYHLALIYHTTRSIPSAKTSFMLPVSSVQNPTPTFTPSDLDLSTLSLTLPPDSKLSLLPSLPNLALALLICAARLDSILDSDVSNFNMAYEEYVAQTARSRTGSATSGIAASGNGATLGGRVWSRNVSRGMWERLVELQLLVPASARGLGTDVLAEFSGAGSAGRGAVVISDTDIVRCDVALEEIQGAVPDMDKVLESWCREL